MKTRKKREKTGKKRARYGLKRVNKEGRGGITWRCFVVLQNSLAELGGCRVWADGALFVRLAWRCASTFRSTDFLGGCNGARLRLPPMRDWPVNADLDGALLVLAPIKERFGA